MLKSQGIGAVVACWQAEGLDRTGTLVLVRSDDLSQGWPDT